METGPADIVAVGKMSETCRGLTKKGVPCSITWGLDPHGYCKFHVPKAARCRGIARSTGRRCNIRWDLNSSGYCHHHATQSPHERVRQCLGKVQATRKRCQCTVGINSDGYCSAHSLANGDSLTRCQGVLLNTRSPCGNNAKPGYAYCCAAHDPSKQHFSPSLFGDPRLRSNVEREVVERYDFRDLYHRDRLDLNTPGNLELDHILEKQCFSYAFQFVDFRDGQEDAEFVASMLREEIVNELPNLCLTRAATNRIKGAAVWHYLDDCLTGHVGYQGAATFNDYMLAENRDSIRLGRSTTRIISSEMGKSLKFCQRELAAQGETPQLDALSDQLQRLFVQMQLHTPPSLKSSKTKTKPKGSSASGAPKSKATKTKKPREGQGEESDDDPLPESTRSKQKSKSKSAPTLNAGAKPFIPPVPSEQQTNDSASRSSGGEPSMTTAEKDVMNDSKPDSTAPIASEKENSELRVTSGEGTDTEPIKETDGQSLLGVKSECESTTKCGAPLPSESP